MWSWWMWVRTVLPSFTLLDLTARYRLGAIGLTLRRALEEDPGRRITTVEAQADKKYALIFGNEVNGVSDEVMANIDACIEIPQFGTKHSFNIVVSAGIVLWDFYVKLNL